MGFLWTASSWVLHFCPVWLSLLLIRMFRLFTHNVIIDVLAFNSTIFVFTLYLFKSPFVYFFSILWFSAYRSIHVFLDLHLTVSFPLGVIVSGIVVFCFQFRFEYQARIQQNGTLKCVFLSCRLFFQLSPTNSITSPFRI